MFRCMRTTIRLNDGLLSQAKSYAAEIGLTFTALIEESLRQRLARGNASRHKPVRLLTTGEDGVHPGIDMDSSASVMDAMDPPGDPA